MRRGVVAGTVACADGRDLTFCRRGPRHRNRRSRSAPRVAGVLAVGRRPRVSPLARARLPLASHFQSGPRVPGGWL